MEHPLALTGFILALLGFNFAAYGLAKIRGHDSRIKNLTAKIAELEQRVEMLSKSQ